MFIGVLHDNSDMDYVRKLASDFLGDDISKGGYTGIVPIEYFMRKDLESERYGMYLTCFYALPETEIEGMALILATEFFGDVVNQFTRKVAKERIMGAATAINAVPDGDLYKHFAQFHEPEHVYWNFLAFLSLQRDVEENVNLVAFPLNGKEIPLIYYKESIIGSYYIRGFEDGMRERQEEERAKHPELANVVTFKSKK